MTFEQLKQKTEQYNEYNDCSVVALALVMDTTYEDAHNLCHKFGRLNHQGMLLDHMLGVLAERGFHTIQQRAPWVTVSNVPYYLNRNHSYLVVTSSHVLAVKGGEVHDWTKDRKHRVIDIYEVNAIDGSWRDLNAPILNAPTHPRQKRQNGGVKYHLRHMETGQVYRKYIRRPKMGLGHQPFVSIKGDKKNTYGKLEVIAI